MSKDNLVRIALFIILVFSSIMCKKETYPTVPENKYPVIVQDAWARLSNPPGDMIWEMSVDPNGVIYAGVQSGLVRSSDNGQTWEQIYSSTPNVVYVSPYDGMIILSVMGTFTTTTTYSTDNGLTWKLSTEQPGSSINTYLSLPDGELLAGGFVHDESSGGMFTSKDKGLSWTRVPDLEKEPSVISFAFNPANDLYAAIGSGFNITKTAIYCSKDKGQSWSKVQKPDSLMIRNMVINRNNELLFSTTNCIYISEANTDNWRSLSLPFKNGFIQKIGLDSNDNILVTFIGWGQGDLTRVLVYSADNKKWYSIEWVNIEMSDDPVSTFVGKDRHLYFATFSSGVYRTKESIDSILNMN